MTDRSFLAMYEGRPDVTKEILKTAVSSKSTRREYVRMKEEERLRRRQSDALSVSTVTEECNKKPSVSDPKNDVIKIQNDEPDVTSFPFIDKVDGIVKKKSKPPQTALEADEHPGHKHRAKLCMVSAVIHMKCIQQRRAKSIRELRKRPTTTLAEKRHRVHVVESSDSEDDSAVNEPLDYLNKCRYVRGTRQDRELTIEEIFG